MTNVTNTQSILDQLDASIFNQSDDRTAAEDWRELRNVIESDSISLRQKNKAYCIYYMFRSQMRTIHFLFNQNKKIFYDVLNKKTMRFYFLVSQWHLEDAVDLRRWKILFWRASYLSRMHRSVSHMTESSS